MKLKLLTLALLLTSNMSFAYSIEDVQKDLPAFTFVTKERFTDFGINFTEKSGTILELKGPTPNHTLYFEIFDRSNGLKNAVVTYEHVGGKRRFYEKIFLVDGSSSRPVLSYRKLTEFRQEPGKLAEGLVFVIGTNKADLNKVNLENTNSDLAAWKQAKGFALVNKKGDRTDFKIADGVEYAKIMSAMEKFLEK